MVSMGTAVFCRIVEEAKRAGLETGRSAGIRATKATMFETCRFGWADPTYVEACATARVDGCLQGKSPGHGVFSS